MSGFVVVLDLTGSPVDCATIDALRHYLADRDPVGGGEVENHGQSVFARWGPTTALASAYAWNSAIDDPGASSHLALAGRIYHATSLGCGIGDMAASLADRFSTHGIGCLDEMNGEFALVFWDARAGVLQGARDRLGLAPFYYYRDETRLICATEARAILALPAVRRAADPLALADYLFSGAALGGRTHFAGIRSLAPGHTLTYRAGALRTAPYWELQFDYQHGRTDATVAAELAELLEDAVRVRAQGGPVVGGQLSGGLDSSVVLGLAARQGHALRAFSIRFDEGAAFDESHYARLVADHFGFPLYLATPHAHELVRYWPALVAEHECPLANAGAFSYHAATRLAASQVDVILAGHGGDEVFGGYRAQFEVGFGSAPWFAATPAELTGHTTLGARLTAVLRREGIRGLLHHLADRGRYAPMSPADRWIQLHCSHMAAEDRLISRDFVRSLGGYSPRSDYLANFEGAPSDNLFDRCLHHDLRTYLPVLLHQSESVARAVGVECRSPLLDHRIVEFAARIAPEQKVRGLVPKYLLRQVASWLPREILERRDKRGFPVPTTGWLTGELAPWASAILQAPATLDRGILDPDELRQGTLPPSAIWRAVNIELWFRIFIDQDPEWCERARVIETEARQRLSERPVPSLPKLSL